MKSHYVVQYGNLYRVARRFTDEVLFVASFRPDYQQGQVSYGYGAGYSPCLNFDNFDAAQQCANDCYEAQHRSTAGLVAANHPLMMTD